jgi:type II secretory pathway pseudopilin PulG
MMKKKRMLKRSSSWLRQRGISLLEVMLSISVIALILVMATRFFYVASNNNKLNTAISQISGLEAAMYSWKGASLSYQGVDIESLFAAGELTNFPGSGEEDGKQVLYTPWGSSQYVVAARDEGGAEISATDIPNCEVLQKAFGERATCDGTTFTYDIE